VVKSTAKDAEDAEVRRESERATPNTLPLRPRTVHSSTRDIVPLSSRAQPLIEGHLALHDDFGIGVRTIQRIIKRVANKANISRPVTPHVLRHTFSVTAVLKGVSLPSLQRLRGHDRLTTTEIYLNLSPEEAIKEFQSKW